MAGDVIFYLVLVVLTVMLSAVGIISLSSWAANPDPAEEDR